MLNKIRNQIFGQIIFSRDENIAVRCFVDLEKNDNPWYAQLYLSGDIVNKLIAARSNEIQSSMKNKPDTNDLFSVASDIDLENTYFSYCTLREIIQQIAFDKTQFTYNTQDIKKMSSVSHWYLKEYVMIEAIYNSRNIDEYDQKHPLEMTDSEIEFMFMQMTAQMHKAIDNLTPMIISGDLLAKTDDKPENDDSLKNDIQ